MRKKRKLIKGAKYHVTARTNRSEFILNTTKNKELFLNIVKRAKKKYKFAITNFCIMGNHIHLMIQPLKTDSLSRIIQWILGTFAVNYNKLYGLIGHVWYDRFHSTIMYNFMQYIRTFLYIEENPVKAKIVNCARQYKYGGIHNLQKGMYEILEPPGNSLKMLFPEICLIKIPNN